MCERIVATVWAERTSSLGFFAWICSSRGGGVDLRGPGFSVAFLVSKIECLQTQN